MYRNKILKVVLLLSGGVLALNTPIGDENLKKAEKFMVGCINHAVTGNPVILNNDILRCCDKEDEIE